EMMPRIRHVLWVLFSVLAGCAGTANPSFPLTSSQAKQAIREMRTDLKPLPRPLVIVGGFLDPDLGPMTLKSFFERSTRDSTIISVSLFSCASFDECRKTIIDAVQQKCPSSDPRWTTEVDVVGMSMGGLAARYAAAQGESSGARRLKIARLFSI